DWKKPQSLEYFLGRFEYLLKFYDYLRLDFARGAYRLYRFFEDPEDKLTLEQLGILDKTGQWQDQVLAKGWPQAAKGDIKKQLDLAKRFYWLILEKLYHSPALNREDKLYFFKQYSQANKKSHQYGLANDSTVYLAREAKLNGQGFKADLKTNGWEHIDYVVERGMTAWDLLPVRQGGRKLAEKEKSLYPQTYTWSDKEENKYIQQELYFLGKYLFPENSQLGPKPQDGLRIGYFTKSPGEHLLSQLVRIAQNKGKVLVTELLGNMPPEKLASLHTLSGVMNYAPGIFLDPVNNEWVRKNKIFRPWSLATYCTHDTTNLEGKAATGDFKGARAAGQLSNQTLTDFQRHGFLDPVVKTDSLLSILMWVDWGKWPGSWTERITNISGTADGNWSCRIPVNLEDLVSAAKGHGARPEATRVISFLKSLPQRKIEDKQPGEKAELVAVFPNLGQVKQQRFIDKGERFELWALVRGPPKSLKILFRDKAYSLEKKEIHHGLPQGVSLYSLSLPAKEFSQGRFPFKVQLDGKITKGKGWLQAAKSRDPNLNPVPVPLRTYQAPTLALSSSSVKEKKITHDFISPVKAGIPVEGLFAPLITMRSSEDWGIFDFEVCKKHVDLNALLGIHIIQWLPITYSRINNSPYSQESGKVIDPKYLSITAFVEELRRAGYSVAAIDTFIKEHSKGIEEARNAPRINYHEKVIPLKENALRVLWGIFKSRQRSWFLRGKLYREYRRFLKENRKELEDHILYLLLKYEFCRDDMFNGWDWRLWNRYDQGLSDYAETGENPAISRARNRHKQEMEFYLFVQFIARRQLRSLIEHARKRGVEFAIDRPVSLEGSDVWLNPDVFGLSSKNGYKRLTTQGLPPEPGQWAGQYWQFFPFDWSNPKTAQFVLKMSKFYHQLGFSYERKDHTLGYYRTFHCVEDIDNQLELNKLKVTPEDDKTLFERVIEVRERVLALS
ncbi:MAG: 4-alpha-glucanotransferase, partial [Candidatus Omnitrophica bacterium]|nr:4-alpha-glucanotransferase [Candidatus Omnitrophota bacterium]